MAEKKLTDEEIIKGLENWILHDCTAKQEDLINALDLIHRLQAENEELKSPKFASWKIKFFNIKEEFDKELAEHEEFTKKAKAEIERLTEENGQLNGYNSGLEYELELKQKRVYELEEERDKLQDTLAEILIAINIFKEEQPKAEGKARDLIDEMKQEAVKDTAKEILQELLKWLNQSISFSNGKSLNGSIQYGAMNKAYHEVKRRVKKIAESKGVEVE